MKNSIVTECIFHEEYVDFFMGNKQLKHKMNASTSKSYNVFLFSFPDDNLSSSFDMRRYILDKKLQV